MVIETIGMLTLDIEWRIKMELNNNLFEYLKEKIPPFEKTTKKGAYLFTCPNISNHKYIAKSPTATIINGTEKISCLQCGFKGTFYDVIRLLEPDKQSYSDEKVMEYLINSLKVNVYSELENYKTYNWSLVPIAKNGKAPLEKDWTNKTHYEKTEWIKWLENGLNLGVRTGEVSKITVIDVDLKIAPTVELEEIYKELNATKTLMQNSPHGKHFVFQYDKEIETAVGINGLTIDIRNDGAQLVVAPSKIGHSIYHWINLGTEIKIVPENVKAKLLSDNKVDNSRSKKVPPELSEKLLQKSDTIKLKNNNLEGCCNDTFVKLGGVLINRLSPDQVEFVLSVFNTQLLENPMPLSAIKGMLGSLEGYKQTEEQTQENSIYEVCKLLQISIGAKDIVEHTGLKRAIVDKYLAKLYKEGKLARIGRGRYNCKQKVEWIDTVPEKGTKLQYQMPYFEDVANFENGDLILIGTPTGLGKTHICMNIIKQMKEQGIKPYYISLESGSRYLKIAESLKLDVKDFYVSKEPVENPTQVELESNGFTLCDWLYTGEDFAMTQSVFKYLSDELRRKGGILVVMTQLKENYDYFAVNLIKSFASFAARYIYDDTTGVIGHFEVDKIRDSKGHYQTARVDCEFSFDTKLLIKKNII